MPIDGNMILMQTLVHLIFARLTSFRKPDVRVSQSWSPPTSKGRSPLAAGGFSRNRSQDQFLIS